MLQSSSITPSSPDHRVTSAHFWIQVSELLTCTTLAAMAGH